MSAKRKEGVGGWRQNGIFVAQMGLTDEARDVAISKLKDSVYRFPVFYGPNYDWVPDGDHGSSGIIGLQEMLMQTDGDKILLLPAWPKDWDVDFKLWAPYRTTVCGKVINGKLEGLEVSPGYRKKDVIIMGR